MLNVSSSLQTESATQTAQRSTLVSIKFSFESALMSLLGIMELFIGLQIWGDSARVPFTNVISLLIVAGGLILTVLSLTTSVLKSHKLASFFVIVMFIFSFASWVYSRVYGNPYYGTDELAFDQYAAQLFVQHIDPYGVSLAPSFDQFHVPVIFHTFTLTGGAVNLLSYPSLSFLPYVPVLMLGIHAQAAVYVDSAFWLLSTLMMYFVLPRPYKPIALVIGMSFTYMEYVVGGVTDALFLPFLILTAWKWDNFGLQDKGITSWIGPIGLGIAMSMKQTAWFLAPFLILAIYMERRSFRKTLAYIGITAITFIVPNIPFIFWNWKSWLQGILAPFISSTVPSGQGLINLTMFEHMGGGDLSLYTYAALALLFALLVSIGTKYSQLKRLIFFLPSIVLFFPTRSFATYLIDLFPLLLVSALSVQAVSDEQIETPIKKWGRIVSYVPFVLLTLWAISIPSPFRMQITGIHTTGELQSIDQVNVTIENRSNRPREPYFTLTEAPQLTSFWHIESGPKILQPGQVATYTLDAPNVDSMPSISGGFIVDAFTTKPSTLSTTPSYQAHKAHTFITPQSFDAPVKLHQKVTLKVQLYDQLGRPIHNGGVRVYLGQVVYDQNGLYPGESSINGATEGKTPVSVLTNKDGVAVFTIEGKQAQSAPIYFQAFIQPNNSYPYGYSQIVSIHFQ